MKRLVILFTVLFLISALFVGCRRAAESPAEEVTGRTEGKGEFSDTDDVLLTEKEVKAFIKAHPVFTEVAKKEGEKFEGMDKSVFKALKGGRQAAKFVEKINKVLKPYGFDMESFMVTYGKIMGTFSYQMGLEAKKLAKGNIKSMKDLLDNPNIPEDQKESIRESIEELEKEDDSEEAKAYKKNVAILEKYKVDLEELFK